MSRTDTPTLQAGELTARSGTTRRSVFGTLARILAMALPLAMGAMVTSTLNLGMVAVLSRAPDTGALGVLSLLQPTFILLLALMEGLAVTNQVFSARSKANWPRRGVLRSTRLFSLAAIVVVALVAGAGYAVSRFAVIADPALQTTLRNFPAFVLSMGLYIVFDIHYAALRGQGRVVRGLLPFAGLAVIDLAVAHLLVTRLGWGFGAVIAANVAGPLVMLPIMAILLRLEVSSGEDVSPAAFKARARQMLAFVGMPVFASIVVGFVSASVVFPVLDGLGRDEAAGFLVVLRLRIAFMIPAIAIGSAMAILVNQASEEGRGNDKARFLVVGVPAMLGLYALATICLPFWRVPLDLLVPHGNAALRAATDVMFSGLLVTFFLVAGSAMLQVILEQLGKGFRSLAVTFLVEAGTCGAVLYAVMSGGGVSDVVETMVAASAAGFALYLLLFLLLLREIGGRRAL